MQTFLFKPTPRRDPDYHIGICLGRYIRCCLYVLDMSTKCCIWSPRLSRVRCLARVHFDFWYAHILFNMFRFSNSRNPFPWVCTQMGETPMWIAAVVCLAEGRQGCFFTTLHAYSVRIRVHQDRRIIFVQCIVRNNEIKYTAPAKIFSLHVWK